MQPLLYTNSEPSPALVGYCEGLSAQLDQVISLLDGTPNHIGLRFLKALLEHNIRTCGAQKASAA